MSKKQMSSEELRQKADELRQQLREANREAAKAAKLEAAAKAEEERNKRISEALEMIAFMKTFQLSNGKSAYDWMVAELEKSRREEI